MQWFCTYLLTFFTSTDLATYMTSQLKLILNRSNFQVICPFILDRQKLAMQDGTIKVFSSSL